VLRGYDLVGAGGLVALYLGIGELAADQPLDRKDGVLRIGDGLPLGDLPDQTLAALGHRHHRRRGARALAVRNHHGAVAFEDGHPGVGRAQIDADHASHQMSPVSSGSPPAIASCGPVRSAPPFSAPRAPVPSSSPSALLAAARLTGLATTTRAGRSSFLPIV